MYRYSLNAIGIVIDGMGHRVLTMTMYQLTYDRLWK